jgi:hypothetical protein
MEPRRKRRRNVTTVSASGVRSGVATGQASASTLPVLVYRGERERDIVGEGMAGNMTFGRSQRVLEPVVGRVQRSASHGLPRWRLIRTSLAWVRRPMMSSVRLPLTRRLKLRGCCAWTKRALRPARRRWWDVGPRTVARRSRQTQIGDEGRRWEFCPKVNTWPECSPIKNCVARRPSDSLENRSGLARVRFEAATSLGSELRRCPSRSWSATQQSQ